MRKLGLISILIAGQVLVGCATLTDTQQRTLSGAAVGAAGGYAVGVTSGASKGRATAIGTAAGALGGFLFDQHQKTQGQRYR